MKNTNYKHWHRQHAKVWEIMPSPARPSIGEVAIVQKYLESCSQEKQKVCALILGSTPEFRDLCNWDCIDVTCVDINKPIYQALTLLQNKPNIHERFIRANWLTLRDARQYNVIMGDAVTTMLPLRMYPMFFHNMSRHMKKGAMLILRLPYQYTGHRIPMRTVMKKYRKMHNDRGVHIYTATFNYLVMNYLDTAQSSIALPMLANKIKELNEVGVITRNEYEVLQPYYDNLTLTLSYPEENYIQQVTKKYFRCLAKEHSMDYLTSYSNPIFVFTKE